MKNHALKLGILFFIMTFCLPTISQAEEGDDTLDNLFPCNYVSEGSFRDHYRVGFICKSDESLNELARLYPGCHELGFEETGEELEILTACEFNNQKQYYHLSINALRLRGVNDEAAMWLKYIVEVKKSIKNGTYIPPEDDLSEE